MSELAHLVLPGDLVFTRAQGGGLVSNVILALQRTWNEPESEASHVALITHVQDGTIWLREQTMPHIRDASLTQTYKVFQVWRLRDLSPIERRKIARMAMSRSGAYGIGKIILFALDALLSRLVSLPLVLVGWCFGRKWRGIEPAIFSRLNVTNMLVCSQWAAKLYYDAVGYEFGGSYITQTPDKMLDHIQRHGGSWERVA